MAPADLATELLGLMREVARQGAAQALAAHASPAPSITPLVDKQELARTLTVSPVTITRLVQEGAPVTYVGQSPRFDVGAFRAWLDARGRQGTKAKPSTGHVVGVRLLSRRGP
jgi:hypothetical protein